MPKMHYFSNKLSKIAKRWGRWALNLQYWEPKLMVIWSNCRFSSWLWRNRTSKNQLWRHRHYVSQN